MNTTDYATAAGIVGRALINAGFVKPESAAGTSYAIIDMLLEEFELVSK